MIRVIVLLFFYECGNAAVQRQKGITDNFVKIELSPLPGPEWQYLSVQTIKYPILDLYQFKKWVYVQVNRSQAQ